MSNNFYQLPPRRYSYEEIAAFPDDARRELHDGTPIIVYAPGRGRSLAYSEVLGRLAMWLFEADKNGQIYHGVDWQLDDSNSLVLDLCFFKGERAKSEIERADNQCLISAPDLVIQILDATSVSSRIERQLAVCAAHRVPFFWKIDVEARTFRTFEIDGKTRFLTSGEPFRPPLFPDSELSWAQIFAEAAP